MPSRSSVRRSTSVRVPPANIQLGTASRPSRESIARVHAGTEKLLRRKGFSLSRLYTILKVYEHGSLIRAAHGDESQSSQYSRQIRQLESFLSFRISKPQGSTLTLNAEGLELARVAFEFFRQLDDWSHKVRLEPRTYTIGAAESLLQWIVVPALSAIGARLTHVNFRLRNLQNADIVRGLEDMSLDFGLLRTKSIHRPLVGVPLGRVEHCLCVPAALLAGREADDVPGLLEELPLAVHLEHTFIEAAVEKAMRERKLRPNIQLRCDTFPNVLAALRTGKYAALMIRFPGAAPLPPGTRAVPLAFLNRLTLAEREIRLAWNPRLLELRPDASSLLRPLERRFRWESSA